MSTPIKPTPTLHGADAQRLLNEIESVECSPAEAAERAALARRRREEMLRPVSDRAKEKQASRDADARALANGEKTREQLRKENGLIRIARICWERIRAPR